MKKINWAVNMYSGWRDERKKGDTYISCDLNDIKTIDKDSLCVALKYFITEVRKLDGSDFPGETLYEIIVCVQMHVETYGFTWKLIDDCAFTSLKFTLDNVMKERCSNGIGSTVRQAQVLSLSDEEFLWVNGFLGTENPTQLLNTVVFLLGMTCVLRAGKEHRSLHSFGFSSQLSWHMDSNGNRYFTYREDLGLKTNKGGLKHRKMSPKVVNVYQSGNRECCPVWILYIYFCKLPLNCTCPALYLRPYEAFTANKWYRNQPVGLNKLSNVVKYVCKNAGFEGYYTNHSLRSTATTRMYHNNCSEQVIQEVKGHRSLPVHGYKRTCEDQRKFACSSIVGNVGPTCSNVKSERDA